MSLESQPPSLATMPSWALDLMMIMVLDQVRHIFSNAPARLGRSRLNCFLPMGRKMIFLGLQSPSPATTPSWELQAMMIMEVLQVRLMCSNAAAQVGRRKRNCFLPIMQQEIVLDL